MHLPHEGAAAVRARPDAQTRARDDHPHAARAGACLLETERKRHLVYAWFSTATPSANRDTTASPERADISSKARVIGVPVRTWASTEDVFLVRLTARLPHGGSDWLLMLQERDLGFVMWPWEP